MQPHQMQYWCLLCQELVWYAAYTSSFAICRASVYPLS